MTHPRWRDAEGNIDWDAAADEAKQAKWDMEDLGDNRSVSRGFGGGCATCDGGGCGDCR